MVVIGYKKLRNFSEQHRDVMDALNNWYIITEK